MGSRLGPYRLLRLLGHGGMGSVFLARREDPYHQEVAIKLMRRDAWRCRDDLGRRLLRERQILARLEHPYIARLYDGGSTDKDHPYLVMERIEGWPIDHFCDDRRWTIRQRLELFQKVLQAVAYAHRHDLVHCDLKPSNILITAEGVPKLLDFGIAKGLRPDTAVTGVTQTGYRPATPGYASPEQVLGGTISPATDVYALGVLLYKLLGGDLPGRTANPTAPGPELPDLRQEPAPPSRRMHPADETIPRLIATRRRTDPRQLARELRGDLDAITLKALSYEPSGRYPTAEALADDIRRYLEGRSVNVRRERFASGAWHRVLSSPESGRYREPILWATTFTALILAMLGLFYTPAECLTSSQIGDATPVATPADDESSSVPEVILSSEAAVPGISCHPLIHGVLLDPMLSTSRAPEPATLSLVPEPWRGRKITALIRVKRIAN